MPSHICIIVCLGNPSLVSNQTITHYLCLARFSPHQTHIKSNRGNLRCPGADSNGQFPGLPSFSTCFFFHSSNSRCPSALSKKSRMAGSRHSAMASISWSGTPVP